MKRICLFRNEDFWFLYPFAKENKAKKSEPLVIALNSNASDAQLGECISMVLGVAKKKNARVNKISTIPRRLNKLLGTRNWREFLARKSKLVTVADLGGLLHFVAWENNGWEYVTRAVTRHAVTRYALIHTLSAKAETSAFGLSAKKAVKLAR